MPDYRLAVPSSTPGDWNLNTDMFALLFSNPGAANVATGNNYIYLGVSQAAAYQTTAQTQAADAAILELQKDHLANTETVTFGASSVTGTLNMSLYTLTSTIDYPAASNVLTTDTVGGSAGTYHAPDAAEVISTAVFGALSATPGTYNVANVSAGNIKSGVVIGGVTGTYTGSGGGGSDKVLIINAGV